MQFIPEVYCLFVMRSLGSGKWQQGASRNLPPLLTCIKVELDDVGKPLTDKELISCMVNGLRVPEYMAERNFLVHNPQTDFEVACALCRKTAIQDTIVAGVVGALPPAAFYTGPPTTPPSLGRRNLGAPELPTSSGSSPAPARLTKALNKLTESISMIQTQLSTQVIAQATVNKSLEDKIAKLHS